MRTTASKAKKTVRKAKRPNRETFPGGVSLSETKHPRYTHVVRWPGPNGRRLVAWFANKTEAKKHAKEKCQEAGELGAAFGSITEQERAALAAWRVLEGKADPKPPPLVEVVADFARRWAATRSGATVAAAVDDFLEAKEAEGVGTFHLAALRSRLGRFKRDLGARPMATISTAEVSDWILALGRKPRAGRPAKRGRGRPQQTGGLSLQTKRNHRLALHSLFAWAKTRGLVGENPVADAAKPRPPQRVPGILKAAEVKAFFAALTEHAPELVPFWAVRVFAGVREQEAVRMEWPMIDLKGCKIILPAAITKTGKPREVAILPALAAFLADHARKAGPLAPQTEMARRYHLGRALKTMPGGFRPPSNWARHTFATMHLHHYRHPGETAMQLGHRGSPELLHGHYAGVATAAEAEAFWAIRPDNLPKPANVIPADFGPEADKPAAAAKPATRTRKAAR